MVAEIVRHHHPLTVGLNASGPPGERPVRRTSERCVSSTWPRLCFYTAALYLLLFCSVAKDMRSRTEVAALGKQAVKVTLGTWGYWRDPEGKSRGPWLAWKSMLRAPLWQVAEKGKPVPAKILNVRRLQGTEVTKSCVVPAAAGVTGDFKTVDSRIHCWQVKLSQLRRLELQLWCTNPRGGSWRST